MSTIRCVCGDRSTAAPCLAWGRATLPDSQFAAEQRQVGGRFLLTIGLERSHRKEVALAVRLAGGQDAPRLATVR